MKVYLYCLALLFLNQCKTIKPNKSIQYVLPYQVELRLLKQLQIVGEQPITFFSLGKRGDNYVITLVQYNNKEALKRMDNFGRVSKTARFLLIDKKFYPLLFDTDNTFGTMLKKEVVRVGVKGRLDNESFGIPRSHSIYDSSFSLTFSSNGEILPPIAQAYELMK